MTFGEFLLKREARNTLLGDFIREARNDQKMAGMTTWAELKSHLRVAGASEQTIEAGRLVWDAYLQAKRKT